MLGSRSEELPFSFHPPRVSELHKISDTNNFSFDPATGLAPTSTFNVGFWFDDPNAAVDCGFNPLNPTPFNGDHKAGPLAMISTPDAITGLGPLSTQPDASTTPASCSP
ncbi:MAG TPA: hypothetical protein VFP65_13385 [Anaeromyxobacteraceae bacterium]|nr:hypothetical protein [Anaeromyxobacteraceae bacterium]